MFKFDFVIYLQICKFTARKIIFHLCFNWDLLLSLLLKRLFLGFLLLFILSFLGLYFWSRWISFEPLPLAVVNFLVKCLFFSVLRKRILNIDIESLILGNFSYWLNNHWVLLGYANFRIAWFAASFNHYCLFFRQLLRNCRLLLIHLLLNNSIFFISHLLLSSLWMSRLLSLNFRLIREVNIRRRRRFMCHRLRLAWNELAFRLICIICERGMGVRLKGTE